MTINEELTHDRLQDALRAVDEAMKLPPQENVQDRIGGVVEQMIGCLAETEKAQTADLHRLALRLIQTRFVLRESRAFLAGLEGYNGATLRPIVESMLGDIERAVKADAGDDEAASTDEQVTKLDDGDAPPKPLLLVQQG